MDDYQPHFEFGGKKALKIGLIVKSDFLTHYTAMFLEIKHDEAVHRLGTRERLEVMLHIHRYKHFWYI